MKSIYFRCDANAGNGYGHFSRCLNIARGIISVRVDVEIIFIGDYAPKARELLSKYTILFIDFSQHQNCSASNLKSLIAGADVFVLDSYKITQQYINDLCNNAYKFVVIDDFYKFNLSKVDLVINFCIDALKHDYHSKEQALGVGYFPYKPEMKKIRESNLNKPRSSEIENILVMIGGHDIYKIGVKVISDLDLIFKNKRITYLSGDVVPSSLTMQKNELLVIPFSDAIEEIFESTDITITGGGLTKYESAYCCIPNGNIPQTIDELGDSVYFEKENMSVRLNVAFNYDFSAFKNNISQFLLPENQENMKKNYQAKFHTNSLYNTVYKIINLYES